MMKTLFTLTLVLLVATAACIVATTMLYTVPPGKASLAITWFVIANISYEMGIVFYNAFLPDIASRDRIGRLSGYGWALGYLVTVFFALPGAVLGAEYLLSEPDSVITEVQTDEKTRERGQQVKDAGMEVE